jgi:cytosine/adenosine deaminase-related metal-dependent hydrolase
MVDLYRFMQRIFSADYIFPVSGPPISEGLIITEEDGSIIALKDPMQKSDGDIPDSEIQRYPGIICPGFVNTHCHLELSFLKGTVPEKLGIGAFIRAIILNRGKFSNKEIADSIEKAENEMIENGIVAVGDISNDDSTFEQKNKGHLKYHTFLEVFAPNPAKAEIVFNKAVKLAKANPQLLTSVVPHAPYSVSQQLFRLIMECAIKNDSIISYHNQESMAESELFISKSGAIFDLFTSLGIELNHLKMTGRNSLRSTLPYFSKRNKTLFVHNTYTEQEDIELAKNWFEPINQDPKLFFCFCPNANLYIENKLPDFRLFIDSGVTCTIGTDSLASNHSLSILEELKVISREASQIPLQILLRWATLNGAKFLGFEKMLGSIEKGKKPGLNLISSVDMHSFRLTPASKVKKLI